jgi:hypothetical protein
MSAYRSCHRSVSRHTICSEKNEHMPTNIQAGPINTRPDKYRHVRIAAIFFGAGNVRDLKIPVMRHLTGYRSLLNLSEGNPAEAKEKNDQR